MMVTEGMWQMVSDLLDGEKLPESMNETLDKLCQGKVIVVDAPDRVAVAWPSFKENGK